MKKRLAALGVLVCAGLWLATGCSSYFHQWYTIPGGLEARQHPKPMEGGYYTNFDPHAVELEVVPMEDTNPVQTQHLLIATVKDKDGKPLPSRRVEWMISEGVGSIVEVDESGVLDIRGQKIDNKYAISHTNSGNHILRGAGEDPNGPIEIKKGQTWCVITSPVEGDTYMVVYAPGIFDWKNHKVFPVKHWRDAKWEWPAPATNPVGTPHDLVVHVMKASSGAPLEGYLVTFTIVDGPDAKLDPGGTKTATVKTDAEGKAVARLTQIQPVEGVNTIEMEVSKPGVNPGEATIRLGTGKTTKTWVAPAIQITKTAPETAGINDEFAYDINVTSPGKMAATNAQVTDPLPEGIAYVSSDPAAEVSGQNLKWSLGTLEPNQEKKLSVRVKATRVGKFENTATVTADMGLSAKASAVTVISAPALKLEKIGPAEVLACEPIAYKLIVTNTGDGAAVNVKIVDNLPEGLESESGKTITVDGGTIQPGKSVESTYTATTKKGGTYENKAVATADGGLTAEATHKVLVKQPVLALTKTGPEKRYLNRMATFELTVTNKGDGEAHNVMLVDTLPDGMEFATAGDNGEFKEGVITWQLGNLAVNESKKVTLQAKCVKIGVVKNTAKATVCCSEATADATVSIEGLAGILLQMVDTDDPIEVGADETYVITVTNQGSSTGTNIQLICTLPDEMDYVSSEGPTTGKSEGKTVTFAPLATLEPQAVATYKVVAKAVKEGDVRVKVVLTSDQLSSSPVMKIESTHLYK